MSSLAGSAISQGPNVGRLDRWSLWRPSGSVQPRWFLLSGSSNPPENISVSKRKPRDAPVDRSGTFLPGVAHDIAKLQDAILPNLFDYAIKMKMTKSEALQHIRELFDECKRKGTQPMLYYTGHGEIGTGNWCFADGTISIQEIFDMLPGEMCYPMIFSDACYSGHWANFCL